MEGFWLASLYTIIAMIVAGPVVLLVFTNPLLAILGLAAGALVLWVSEPARPRP